MGHLSSVLNASSTVFTMDLYRPLLARNKTEEHLFRVGRWSGFSILLLATLLARWFTRGQHRVFLLIQDVGAWVAAPIAVAFLVGVLWKRATAAAATTVLFFGFPYTWLVESVLFKQVSWLMPFDNWLNRTFLVWITCLVLMIAVSWLTPAPAPEKVKGMIWSFRGSHLPPSERERNRGLRNLTLWWGIFMLTVAGLHAYIL